ncbi:hypothetical protein [Massilia horti]|uniref:Phasin family protein n=1 Tax=Massilia horti TaxID=2562153 RepID=A0A4Y9T5H9_9BURK|nr:hypothetical protein [Massilia horti]TFW33247.1 hypothetical protein E4O92_07245 [Massilia horti]
MTAALSISKRNFIQSSWLFNDTGFSMKQCRIRANHQFNMRQGTVVGADVAAGRSEINSVQARWAYSCAASHEGCHAQPETILGIAMTKMNNAPVFGLDMNHIFVDTSSKIAALYSEAMRASAEQLWVSSARIVQEHVMQALVAASQSCAEALAKNAAAVQQQAFSRLAGANQQAAEMMGRAFVDSWMAAMKPPSMSS